MEDDLRINGNFAIIIGNDSNCFFKKNSKALMIRKIEEMDTERLKRTEATIFDGVTNWN